MQSPTMGSNNNSNITANNINVTNPYNQIFNENQTLLMQTGYVVLTTLGIGFNTIVCYLIIRHRHLRVIVNILIFNLALSDIVACFSVYPFVFLDISKTTLRGRSANLMCGLTEGLSLFFIVATVSLLTLSVLSISRYIVISHPLKLNWRLKKGNIKYIFSLIWITSAALLIPSSVSFEYDEKKQFCVRSWAPGIHKMVYFCFTGVLGFFIPVFSLTFTYFTSVHILWFKKKPATFRARSSSITTNANLNVKKRVSILLGTLIIVYLLCWMPFAIYWLLSAGMGYYDKEGDSEIDGIRIARITVFIALSNTVLNPIVYAFTNVHLREALVSCIKCKKVNAIKQKSSMSGGMTIVSYTGRSTKDKEIAFIPYTSTPKETVT